MGVNKPLTFLLPLYCFFSGKFMIISYFFGVFRVFSPVNFLYAQPMHQMLPANYHTAQESPAFCAGNVRSSGVIFAGQKKPGKQISPFSGSLTFLINL